MGTQHLTLVDIYTNYHPWKKLGSQFNSPVKFWKVPNWLLGNLALNIQIYDIIIIAVNFRHIYIFVAETMTNYVADLHHSQNGFSHL